jgi:hypothetical protein
MNMLMALGVLFVAVVPALQGKSNPDFKYEEKAGVSITKFPKNDEWDFKEMGKYAKNPKLVVANKVDELWIEVVQVFPSPNTTGWDLKKQIETDYAGLSGDKNLTEVKQVAMQPSKLPQGGGNGANAMFCHATFKFMDKAMEKREWDFVGKENQCLYIVMVTGDDGNYKKYQKIIEFILGQIKTYKIPK